MSITTDIISEIEGSDTIQALMSQQEELEARMRSMGVDRYWTAANRSMEAGNMTNTKPGRMLLNHSIITLSAAIKEWVETANAGGAGRRNDAVKFIEQLDPDSLAMITARTVLDGVSQTDTTVSLARRVGTLVMDEIFFRQLKEEDPIGDHIIRQYNAKSHHYDYKRRWVRTQAFQRDVVNWQDWMVTDLVKVGAKLIDLMITSTGLVVERVRTIEAKRKEASIVATEETMAWIAEEHNRREVMSPMLLPTIVPPRPWTDPFTGGYWTSRVRNLSLVKTFTQNYLHELNEQSDQLQPVYDAVNAVQHTGWHVNKDVMDVVRHLWDTNHDSGVIPQPEDIPIPPKPASIQEGEKEDWNEEQLEDFKSWKRVASETHTRNARLKSLRLQFVKTLMVAEMFEYNPAIYFPYQLDFRGRMYPVPMFLHPQGADLARGLLEFAEGKPIETDEAERWLAIHGANCYGNDKVSLNERVAWARAEAHAIKAVAEDPLSNQWWMDADKPFQFLQWCFDWSRYMEKGYGYVSRLSVQMDGSCNGIQNFSAALLDAIGGEAVNLTPGVKPQDIYQRVADVVIEQVKVDAANHERDDYIDAAQGWIQTGITRKTCKRPVMTLAYGATRFGFCQQIMDDTVTPMRYELGHRNMPWQGSGWKAAEYLGGVIWDKVGSIVVAARQAMDWFQESARLAAKEGLPVRWTTPDGFVALQSYPLLQTRRVRLTLGTSDHWLTVATGFTDKLDKRRQANGISPNWVHSMDASHLRATVRACWAQGVRGFSMIHDSYGTHAADAAVLGWELRKEFLEMYSEPVMEQFRDELSLQLPPGVELPDLPPTGSLVLSQVLDSQYFFA